MSSPTLPKFPLSPHLLTGLATVPLLSALILGRNLSAWCVQVGVASEELLRGTRLPVLPTTDPTELDA